MSDPATRKLRGSKNGKVAEITRLKALWREEWSDEQKAQFNSWFNEPNVTNAEIRKRIQQRFGIALIYDTQLSEFRSWADAQADLDKEAERQADDEAKLREQYGNTMSNDEIAEEVMKRAYMRSLVSGDFKLGLATSKEHSRRKMVSQNQVKLEITTCDLFLKWYGDKKARDIAESNMSNADKIAALRQTYFADVDALEKSGKVKLPE